MVTSSHRYEVVDEKEFNIYQDKMDEWWDGKQIDILYFGQPPQTNDNVIQHDFKKSINNQILLKCIDKNYLYYDMDTAMGGQRV